MAATDWLIYGASGYTGGLIAAEAVRRGHRPILAGRTEMAVRAVAEPLGLPWQVFSLDDEVALRAALAHVSLVLVTAGPLGAQVAPIVAACLATGTHYLDTDNEIPTMQRVYAYDAQARLQGIALLPGVGFGVVATNCLAKFVAELLPDAVTLDGAMHIAALTQSTGAAQTGLALLQRGGQVYRQGRFVPYRLGRGARTVAFWDEPRIATPTPLGDLFAAVQATHIPNITLYSSALPAGPTGLALPLIRRLMRLPAVYRQLLRQTSRTSAVTNTDTVAHSQAWAVARNRHGDSVEAWLAMGEGYAFTAAASVLAIERLLAQPMTGFLAPAQAFGADFVLSVPGTQRYTKRSQPTVTTSHAMD